MGTLRGCPLGQGKGSHADRVLIMPSNFAYFTILIWPLVTIVLFRMTSPTRAAVISIVFGYLFLPVQTRFNLPLLPAYDKDLAAGLPALIMLMILSGSQRRTDPTNMVVTQGWLPQVPLLKLCFIVLLASPFVTSLVNNQPVVSGGRVLQALGPYDAASAALSASVTLIPFLIARKFLAHPRDHAMLLGVLCLAGLIYSLPTLFEVRMSPQLNRMVYGISPNWLMSQRGGGYRPSVFMGHGLRLGIFLAVATLATLGFLRTRTGASKLRLYVAAAWLLVTLVLCKSLGALQIAAALAPVILFLNVRIQLLVAASLAALVLLFPMARSTGIFPVDTVTQTVAALADEDRQRSLNFRFKNEDILLDHASKRPLFGWGGWGRARVYDENGNSAVTTDGLWIIIFGEGGWVRYLSQFGLMTFPIILLALRRRRLEVTFATSALALVLVANLIDLIPNSGMSSLVWLAAGAIAGRLDLAHSSALDPVADTSTDARGSRKERIAYSRFPNGRREDARSRYRPTHKEV